MFHTLIEDDSGTQFQIRNISCCSMLLGVTSYTISTQFQMRKKCMLQLLGLRHTLSGMLFQHLRIPYVMPSVRKHGRSGITKRKKSAGQEGQHHHKREKEFDKET